LGALPAVSYSFGAGKHGDVLSTLGHCIWLTTLIPIVISVGPVFFPRAMASCWERDADYLDMADAMLPPNFYGAVVLGLLYTIPVAVQGLQRPWLAALLAVFGQFLPLPIASIVLHVLWPDTPARLMLAYTFSDAVASPFAIVVGVWIVRRLRRMPDTMDVRDRIMTLPSGRAGPASDPGVKAHGYVDFIASLA
jgi:Na+-driven multidrug efflux pump